MWRETLTGRDRVGGRAKAVSLQKLSGFASLKRGQCYIQRSKHQGNRAEQLNQHVERWTGGILERITDSIANHACLVRLTLLTQDSAVGVETVNHLALLIHAQVAGLDVLLCIVPCTAAVVQEGCDDDTAHRTDHQHASFGLRTKNGTNSNGGQSGYQSRQDHSA